MRGMKLWLSRHVILLVGIGLALGSSALLAHAGWVASTSEKTQGRVVDYDESTSPKGKKKIRLVVRYEVDGQARTFTSRSTLQAAFWSSPSIGSEIGVYLRQGDEPVVAHFAYFWLGRLLLAAFSLLVLVGGIFISFQKRGKH